MALFDKLVCNLSELYYLSNPETKAVFAPAHAPDMLYHLFWTFLFIDQEFRNTRSRPKVTCNYFVHLLQNEGGGYPREYFDKKVLKVRVSEGSITVLKLYGKKNERVLNDSLLQFN